MRALFRKYATVGATAGEVTYAETSKVFKVTLGAALRMFNELKQAGIVVKPRRRASLAVAHGVRESVPPAAALAAKPVAFPAPPSSPSRRRSAHDTEAHNTQHTQRCRPRATAEAAGISEGARGLSPFLRTRTSSSSTSDGPMLFAPRRKAARVTLR